MYSDFFSPYCASTLLAFRPKPDISYYSFFVCLLFLFLCQIFAVLGLRALYFALAAAMTQFSYLGPALGLILCFIGGKMLLGSFGAIHVGVETTLLVVLATVAVAVVLSIVRPRQAGAAKPEPETQARHLALEV